MPDSEEMDRLHAAIAQQEALRVQDLHARSASNHTAGASMLGSIGGAINRLSPEIDAEWRAKQERQEQEYAEERRLEREERHNGSAQQLRTAALHAALMCDAEPKTADRVISDARDIEAFLAGPPAAPKNH